MIKQALRDRVDILDATTLLVVAADVPAYVYTVDSVTPSATAPEQAWRLMDTLRATLDTDTVVDRIGHKVRWRGEIFALDANPMWRRKNGQDHHQTVTLQRVEG